MTQNEATMKAPLRLLLVGAGALIAILGVLGVISTVRFFLHGPDDLLGSSITSRDMIFMGLLGVVALCFIATGLSLLLAAIRRKSHNVVPGPTIYVLGVSLVATAMLFFSVAAYLPGALLAVAGLYAMWIEYRSAFI